MGISLQVPYMLCLYSSTLLQSHGSSYPNLWRFLDNDTEKVTGCKKTQPINCSSDWISSGHRKEIPTAWAVLEVFCKLPSADCWPTCTCSHFVPHSLKNCCAHTHLTFLLSCTSTVANCHLQTEICLCNMHAFTRVVLHIHSCIYIYTIVKFSCLC